jgi:hypothetical protein
VPEVQWGWGMSQHTAAPDLIIGAPEIAKYLGLPVRSVYAMREANHPALVKEPGLGLCARKSRLDAIGLGAHHIQQDSGKR